MPVKGVRYFDRMSVIRLLGLSLAPLLGMAHRGGRAAGPDGGPRVLLIGIDGADMRIVDRLVGEGKLPNFARLKREGAWGPLRSVEPLLSPLVWTSIATGRRPQDHGVFDFVEITPDGEPTPITSTRRLVPALWNLAGRYGRNAGFIGWYASYPAEEVRGFIVSDRVAFHQVKSDRATRGATYPEALAVELREELGEPAPDVGGHEGPFPRESRCARHTRRREAAGGAGEDPRHERALPEDGAAAPEALLDGSAGRLFRDRRRVRAPLHGGRAAAPAGRGGARTSKPSLPRWTVATRTRTRFSAGSWNSPDRGR